LPSIKEIIKGTTSSGISLEHAYGTFSQIMKNIWHSVYGILSSFRMCYRSNDITGFSILCAGNFALAETMKTKIN